MMTTREALEWYFKQQDHSVGLSFKSNFHFALVGHLIKGFRHPASSTVSRTTRVLGLLLDIVGKSGDPAKDKFAVTKDNIAYLAALVSVSDEVRSRCHVKHTIPNMIPDSPTFDSFAVDHHLKAGGIKRPNSGLASPMNENYPQAPHSAPPAANQRQKSLECMDPQVLEATNKLSQKHAFNLIPPSKLERRSNSVPVRNNADQSPNPEDHHEDHDQPRNKILDDQDNTRPSISNDTNILLDPEVLDDQVTQVLVLTVMATLVKYTTDESEVRILYEYLAEASVVFPKVFPVIHSLLDAKIVNVLSLCHDKTILAAVQSIIENMISCEDTSQQQLHFLQSCGFGGLWRFAGFFTKSNSNAENVELFVNCLEALVETCLPSDENDQELNQYPSMLSVSSIAVSSNIKLSSSLTSISLASPIEKLGPNTTPF